MPSQFEQKADAAMEEETEHLAAESHDIGGALERTQGAPPGEEDTSTARRGSCFHEKEAGSHVEGGVVAQDCRGENHIGKLIWVQLKAELSNNVSCSMVTWAVQ